MWTIQLPLRVPVSKNRDFSLNLNQYRNAHYQTLDKAKKNFTHLAEEKIQEQQVPRLERCALEYVLYPGTRQLCDVNNVCSVVDKFFSDSLVSAGILADDNYNFIADSRFKFGHIDRENPRVEVIIRDLDQLLLVPEKPSPETTFSESITPMKIQTTTTVTLSQDDVRTAVLSYLKSQGIEADLQEMNYASQGGDLILTMVSGASGASAPVALAAAAAASKPAAAPAHGSTGSTRKQKLEPKVAMQAVEAAQAAKHVEEISSEPECEEPAEEATASASIEPAVEEIDHSPKTPEELARDATKYQEPAKPAKGPSLFAGFKRPQN